MESDRDVWEIIKAYKWTITLAVCGFLFAVCIINYGFFKSLLIAALVAAGIWGGLHLDKAAGKGHKSEDSYYNDQF